MMAINDAIQSENKSDMYRVTEWHARHTIMEAVLDVLSDGKRYTSRQILQVLQQRGVAVPKKLVNSVLFSEARRYVFWDKKTFTYQLREITPEEMDKGLSNIVSSTAARVDDGGVKAKYIGRNDEYKFLSSSYTGPVFFEVQAIGPTIEVRINHEHLLFTTFEKALEPARLDDVQDLLQQLYNAQKLLQVLLAAWAKYETSLPDGPRKHKAEELRGEWGRYVQSLLMEEKDESADPADHPN